MIERILHHVDEADQLKAALTGNTDETVQLLLEKLAHHPAIKAIKPLTTGGAVNVEINPDNPPITHPWTVTTPIVDVIARYPNA